MSAPVPTPPPRPGPPRPAPPTPDGHDRAEPGAPDLDRLVHGLDDLADRPVAEHHDRLAAVHESLHSALNDQPPAS